MWWRQGFRVGVMLLVLAAPASAGAATQIGQTLDPSGSGCNAGFTWFQGVSPGDLYAAPSAGVITAWSFQASADPPSLKLKVGRRAGGNAFTILAESDVKSPAPGQLATYTDVRIPVQIGDVIGFYIADIGDCSRPGSVGFDTFTFAADVPVGSTATFSAGGGYALDIAATLEADCDGDGFGDETQDTDTRSCPPAPETTITKGPKDKTKKKRATFEFTANEQGATFECSLDGGAFASCTSPHTVKVKRGKHDFQLRASDSGNNVEGSPAIDNWKVKKKKKK